MTVIDLTHLIREGMPVYPGTEPPVLTPASSHDKDGYWETKISMFSHTGTHIDSPAHIIKGAKRLDEFEGGHFVGKALVIDCRDIPEGSEIGLDKISLYGKRAEEAEFLLFLTGWDKLWGSDDYFKGYPVLSREALDYVISGGYKGIGFDTISIDPSDDPGLPRHKRLFSEAEIINIENLTGLEALLDKEFILSALPLKFENSDGAPARAVAIINQ